jgi:hypothetical protein
MTFDAPAAAITLDGDFSDWQCAEIKAQTPFYPYNKATPTMPADGDGTHCCGDKVRGARHHCREVITSCH